MSAYVSAAIRAALGKYDIVHFHAEDFAFMCGLPKPFGKQAVVTIHGAAVIIGTTFYVFTNIENSKKIDTCSCWIKVSCLGEDGREGARE